MSELPRYEGGLFLFSTTNGRKPISAFSKAKNALDALMKEELAKEGHTFEAFKIHDLRRTVRSKLSELKIGTRDVRELLLAHTLPKIQRIYDTFEFADEKREALIAWHIALRSIIEPATGNVVKLRA